VQENLADPQAKEDISVLERLPSVSLFYKIFIANAGILVLAAVTGMVVVLRLSSEISASTAFLGPGMVDRAAHAAGTLRVDSRPGDGMRLTTEAPKPLPERVGNVGHG
tara:strand:+ start:203 stop:526 length:324 start_codon:yes stop_codon:yes gene_type:complete